MILIKFVFHTFGPFCNLAAKLATILAKIYYLSTELATVLGGGTKSVDENF